MIDDKAHDIMPPPGAPGWATPELLQDTLDTWQPHYHEQLTVADALDILLAVSRLIDTVRQA